MPIADFSSNLGIVLGGYRHAALATRFHVLGRFVSCPFQRVLPHLPPNARLLDLGAGHGLFARLALRAGARAAVTLEPDLPKVLATPAYPGIRAVAAFADSIQGTFDAASICDVFCRIPTAQWDGLLAVAFARLRPGGVLLLKEIDGTNRWKAGWNRLQEYGADLLGLTLGGHFSYEPPAAMLARLERAGFEDRRAIPIGAGYPHAHILYVGRRPEAASSIFSPLPAPTATLSPAQASGVH